MGGEPAARVVPAGREDVPVMPCAAAERRTRPAGTAAGEGLVRAGVRDGSGVADPGPVRDTPSRIQRCDTPALAATPALMSAPPRIQRKVGFEFEIETPLYTEGPPTMLDRASKVATKFAKDERLHDQHEFHIVQDHTASGWAEVGTIPEFVIHPAEESLDEASFLANVRAAQDYVREVETKRNGIAKLQKGAFAGPLSTVRGGGAQATFGVRPEGVATVLGDKAARVKASPLHEADIATGAMTASARLMALPQFSDAPDDPGKLRGLIDLICMYCVSNSLTTLQKGDALDKNKVPFLLRSTIGAVAQQTLTGGQRDYLSTNSESLAKLILETTGAHIGTPIISPTAAEKDPVPNVNAEAWVVAALKGEDEPLRWGSEDDDSDSKLIAPERVGTPTDDEDDNRPYGAVVEERNVKQGAVTVQNWNEVAREVWEYVRKANGIE